MSATPEQIAKLPRWAQRHIDTLERNLAAARERIAIGKGLGVGTNTFAEPYAQPPLPLGRDVTVRFLFGGDLNRSYIDAALTEAIEFPDGRVIRAPALRVMSSDALAVSPQSSNVVEVRNVRL